MVESYSRMGLYRERIGVSIVTNARTAAPRRLGGGGSARWKGGRHLSKRESRDYVDSSKHFIGTQQQVSGHLDPNHLCHPNIYDELKPGDLLNRDLTRG